jgi:hypothetical protein
MGLREEKNRRATKHPHTTHPAPSAVTQPARALSTPPTAAAWCPTRWASRAWSCSDEGVVCSARLCPASGPFALLPLPSSSPSSSCSAVEEEEEEEAGAAKCSCARAERIWALRLLLLPPWVVSPWLMN